MQDWLDVMKTLIFSKEKNYLIISVVVEKSLDKSQHQFALKNYVMKLELLGMYLIQLAPYAHVVPTCKRTVLPEETLGPPTEEGTRRGCLHR